MILTGKCSIESYLLHKMCIANNIQAMPVKRETVIHTQPLVKTKLFWSFYMIIYSVFNIKAVSAKMQNRVFFQIYF